MELNTNRIDFDNRVSTLDRMKGLFSANKIVIAAVMGGAILAGSGFGIYSYFKNLHEAEMQNLITNNMNLLSSKQFIGFNIDKFKVNKLNKIDNTSVNFDNNYSKIDNNLSNVIKIINPDNTHEMLKENFIKNKEKVVAMLNSDVANYNLAKELQELTILKNKGQSYDEERFSALIDILDNTEQQVDLQRSFSRISNNTEYHIGLLSLNSELNNKIKNANNFYENMKKNVEERLANKDYDINQTENEFINATKINTEEMYQNISTIKNSGNEALIQARDSGYNEIDRHSLDLDYSDREQLKNEVNNEIAIASSEIDNEIANYIAETQKYNQYVLTDIQEDKKKVEEMANSQNHNEWGPFEYFLLYNWLSSSNHNTHIINNHYNSGYNSLYSDHAYNSGYKNTYNNYNHDLDVKKYYGTKTNYKTTTLFKTPSKVKSLSLPQFSKLKEIGTFENKFKRNLQVNKLNNIGSKSLENKLSKKINENISEKTNAVVSSKINNNIQNKINTNIQNKISSNIQNKISSNIQHKISANIQNKISTKVTTTAKSSFSSSSSSK